MNKIFETKCVLSGYVNKPTTIARWELYFTKKTKTPKLDVHIITHKPYDLITTLGFSPKDIIELADALKKEIENMKE